MQWNSQESTSTVLYDFSNQLQQSGPRKLDDFITTAVIMISTDSAVIISNATLKSAKFSNNNNTLTCDSPCQDNDQTATITIAGTHK